MIGRQFVARLLIIVSRTNPAQQTYLKHVFGSQTEDVILDRRVGERRQHLAPVAAEKRSEEHTSELQSLAYLVCRLLLEKKKKKTTYGCAKARARSKETATEDASHR